MAVSNTLEILSNDACRQPIYLRWKNLLGGWDYWLFQWSQDSVLSITQGEEFKQVVSDVATATEVFQYYKKQGREVLTLFAENINANEVETIRKIALSPKVEMLEENNVSPLVWFTVLVDTNSIGSYQTENKLNSISFEVRLKEIQTLSN